MKILFIAVVALTTIVASCEKTYPSNNEDPVIQRTFRFQLYTDKDFSNETSVIRFSIFVRNTRKTLFDSSLAEMKVKDIPDSAHKIIIEKTLSVSGQTDLAAGFHYEIENVGNSGYTDTSKAGNAFKIIDFPFQ